MFIGRSPEKLGSDPAVDNCRSIADTTGLL